MPQQSVWEKEYRNPRLVTKESEPQNDVLRFLKFLRKEAGIKLEGLTVLDAGCGTGRNSNYIAELGNTVSAFDISPTALRLAESRAKKLKLDVEYLHHDMGSSYPWKNETFDIALDITSSNSLNNRERAIYVSEVSRVLKKDGFFFVKALCKDGDDNAKALIKKNPGPEKDTYIMKEMKLVERVFTREDFIKIYSPYFKIIKLTKKTSYTKFNNQSYKRNFWLAYMQKI